MAATPSAAAALSHLRSALSRRRGRLPWWSRSWPGAHWGWPSGARLLSGGRCLSQASDPFLRGSYDEVSRRAAEAPGAFWGALAQEALLWDAAHHTDCEWDFAQGRVRWFLGGRLNVAELLKKQTTTCFLHCFRLFTSAPQRFNRLADLRSSGNYTLF